MPSIPHSHIWLPWLLVSMVSMVTFGQQEWSPWDDKEIDPWRDPPWGRPGQFNDKVVVRTYYGDVRGFSVPYHIYDLNWDPRYEGQPPWYTQRVNCFLGVPYAEPPLGPLRFKRTKPPRWGGTWEADHYRPSCPQDIGVIRQDIPTYPKANVSEDCLYLNIFAPNITWHSRDTLYPVIVWIHSGDFVSGTAQTTPGHVLATRDVVIVNFNYRLGALGFLTTEDEYTSGNYGLWDQHRALEFISENIRAFRGDPNRITLAGEGAGAVSVGMHLLSPFSRGKDFFHQTILMSGTDLSRMGFVSPYWQPRDYALQLGRLVGCDTEDTYLMLKCLRDNKTVSWKDIVAAQSEIEPKDGKMGVVWAPVQDGGWYNSAKRYREQPFLPETPTDLRNVGKFDALPCIIGLNTHDGAKLANETFGPSTLEAGLFKGPFRRFVGELLKAWQVDELYHERALEAVEFQYTWWPEPDNRTAQTQEFFNLLTDLNYGMGMDRVVRLNSETQPTWMFQFNYKSWTDWLPYWMGVGYSAAVPYVFGVPFMKETILNQTELEWRQNYDYQDRNMSDWMMYMFTNFAKYGNPTPNITYNLTWWPFNEQNYSYLVIEEPHSYMWFRYRQNKYSFWREYFPDIAKPVPYFPTPTPAGYEYVISTGSLTALMLVLLTLVLSLAYLLWWQSAQQRRMEEYREQEIPLSFMSGASRSQSTATVHSAAPSTVAPSHYSHYSGAAAQPSQYSQSTAKTAPSSYYSSHYSQRGKSPGSTHTQHSVC